MGKQERQRFQAHSAHKDNAVSLKFPLAALRGLWRHSVPGTPADKHGMEEGRAQREAEDAGALAKRIGLVLKFPGKKSLSEQSFPWQR